MQTEEKRRVQKSKTFHCSPSNFHIFSINGSLSKKLISSENKQTSAIQYYNLETEYETELRNDKIENQNQKAGNVIFP
jgi:hypothetical protein